MDHHDLIILRVVLGCLVAFLNLVMVIVVLITLRHFLAILKGTTVSSDIVFHQVLIELALEHRGTLQVVVNLHAAAVILTCPIDCHVLVQNR